MVVAMWKEGNESSARCIDMHGYGHVIEEGESSLGNEMISYMVVAMRDKRRVCVIGVFICLIIYMCVWCTFMFYLLAHPICLCLAMIVYAVHVSR